MTFIKGESGNKNGRPKGSVSPLKKKLKDFMEGNADKFLEDILKMDDQIERTKFIVQLMPYVLPKMKETDVSITGGDGEPIRINVEIRDTDDI